MTYVDQLPRIRGKEDVKSHIPVSSKVVNVKEQRDTLGADTILEPKVERKQKPEIKVEPMEVEKMEENYDHDSILLPAVKEEPIHHTDLGSQQTQSLTQVKVVGSKIVLRKKPQDQS